jgi:hypothetical protein
MGTPTSAVFAETYVECMKHEQIHPILIKHQITGYFWYAVDILITNDQNKTNIKQITYEFNELQPFIKFTMENKLHNSSHFLDPTIHREDIKLKFSIHKNPMKQIL